MGFHDGGFDLFDIGSPASPALERLAEDADWTDLHDALQASNPGAVSWLTGSNFSPGWNWKEIDGAATPFISFAAQILPSNDAFVGTDDTVQLFDDAGDFLGPQTFVLHGSDILDAGTEVNTEIDANGLDQTVPDAGMSEGGVVRRHAGYDGSLGNPVGEGDASILGGLNQSGIRVDPEISDFTRPDHVLGTLRISAGGIRTALAPGQDVYRSGEGDEQVLAYQGPAIVHGNGGFDVLLAESGEHRLFGGADNDILDGGADADRAYGGTGDDFVRGGDDDDRLDGGPGNDLLVGDAGDDLVRGGDGDDAVWINDGRDVAFGGTGDDYIFAMSHIENVRAYGDDGDDPLIGGYLLDRLEGGAGNDTLSGVPGRDRLDGGDGDDLIRGDGWETFAVVDPAPVGAPPDEDLRDLIRGGDGDDRLFGDGGHDLIFGGAGNDTLTAGRATTGCSAAMARMCS